MRQVLYLILCFNFTDKLIYFIDNITNNLILLIFYDMIAKNLILQIFLIFLLLNRTPIVRCAMLMCFEPYAFSECKRVNRVSINICKYCAVRCWFDIPTWSKSCTVYLLLVLIDLLSSAQLVICTVSNCTVLFLFHFSFCIYITDKMEF